jgi:DNA-binding CsgD family transcriptional regulator
MFGDGVGEFDMADGLHIHIPACPSPKMASAENLPTGGPCIIKLSNNKAGNKKLPHAIETGVHRMSRRTNGLESFTGAEGTNTSREPGSESALAKAARRREQLAAVLLERPLGCLVTTESGGLPISAELAALQQAAIQTLWATSLATIELFKAYRRVTWQLSAERLEDKTNGLQGEATDGYMTVFVSSASFPALDGGDAAKKKIGGVTKPSAISTGRTGKADILARWKTLTRRQAEVLEWLSQGLPNKEIAAKLGVSDTTVKAHVGEISRKLHVYNRTRLIAMLAGVDTPSRVKKRR